MTPIQQLQQMLLDQAKEIRLAGDNPLKLEKKCMQGNALANVAQAAIKAASVEVAFLKHTEETESYFFKKDVGDISTLQLTETSITEDNKTKTVISQKVIPSEAAGKRAVVIDKKTTIYVDASIDDETAIKNFHAKRNQSNPNFKTNHEF